MLNAILKKSRIISLSVILFSILTLNIQPVSAAVYETEQNDQERSTVKGVVSDESGEPLTGVTVVVKGDTQQGTFTDLDGKFSINAPANGTLVFSFLGMDNVEVPVNGRKEISVTMKNNAVDLSDVVVIGYGKQSRATITSSISKLDATELAKVPSGSPLVMMQGKVPGVNIRVNSGQPGAEPQFIVRGGTTTSPESDAPLYIVDGVIRPNMRDINSNDIADIQVLKDAASTAMYGSKASNGIVMVTTKSGKSGEGKISFSYGLMIDKQGKRHPLSDAREYLTATRGAIRNIKSSRVPIDSYLANASWGMTTSNPRNSLVTTEYLDTYIANYGQAYTENLLYNQGWEMMADPYDPSKMLIFKNTDYQDEMFQNAIGHDYNLNFSGGNDKSTYYLSFGYLDQDGIVLGTDYKRWSGLLNASYKIKPNVTVRGIFDYALRKTSGVGNENNVMARASKMPPTMRLYYEDGTPAPGERANNFRSRRHEVYYQEKWNKVGRMNLSTELDWEIIKGLHFKPSFSYYNNEGENHSFERANEVTANRPASANHDVDRQYQYEAVINYTKSFKNIHNFNLTAGTNFIYSTEFDMGGTGYGGTSDYIETLNGTGKEGQTATSKFMEKKTNSYFGRLTYDYDRKYLLSASVRYDGSSHFAANNKFGTFPGVSAGWNMHRENFWEPMKDIVNNLKLRLSWGKTGLDNLSLSHTEGAYTAGKSYMGESGILNTTLANKSLLWETTTSTDGGLDIGLFDSKVNLMVDVYHKKTTNRLLDEKLWAESGFSSIRTNFGSIVTNGIEIQIDATPVKTRDFSWDISANFSYHKTFVDKLPDNGAKRNRTNGGIIFDERLGKYIETGGFAEGERFGARYAFVMDGVYATDEEAANAPYDDMVSANWKAAGTTQQKYGGDAIWRDLDKNDTIDTRDMKLVGYIHPDKIGGITNTFRYKKFSLRVAMDFELGHVIDNQFRAQANANSRNNFATVHDVASSAMWKNQGDQASIPRYDVYSDWDYGVRNHGRPGGTYIGFSGGSMNTHYIKKGDYLAFREVSLSYLLENRWLKTLGVPSVELMGAVYNLGYWTAYDGLTPEVYGADAGKYPRPRQFMFSLKFTL